MTDPVTGSTPPQKLKGSLMTTSGPAAVPGTTATPRSRREIGFMSVITGLDIRLLRPANRITEALYTHLICVRLARLLEAYQSRIRTEVVHSLAKGVLY